MTVLRRFFSDTRGSTAIEYGLICSLMFLVVVGAMQTFGVKVTSLFDFISGEMGKAG